MMTVQAAWTALIQVMPFSSRLFLNACGRAGRHGPSCGGVAGRNLRRRRVPSPRCFPRTLDGAHRYGRRCRHAGRGRRGHAFSLAEPVRPRPHICSLRVVSALECRALRELAHGHAHSVLLVPRPGFSGSGSGSGHDHLLLQWCGLLWLKPQF